MTSKYLLHHSLALLTSCLESVKIPYRFEGDTVFVAVKDGGETRVDLSLDQQKTLTSRDVDMAQRAFADITEASGWGRLRAVDRGSLGPPQPGRKTNRPYGDDLDRVVLRETLFRTVPDPGPQVYQYLDSVIMTCCRFFLGKNHDLCLRLGYDLGDLKTYAQVWIASFWATGRVLTPVREDENQRLAYRFLRQRFAEFYRQMRDQRSRSVIMDRQSILVGLGLDYVLDGDSGSVHELRDGSKAVKVAEPDRDEDEEREFQAYRARRAEIDTFDYVRNPDSRAEKRRLSAREVLDRHLNRLSLDQRQETLAWASQNQALCPDARKTAGAYLKKIQSQVRPCPCTRDQRCVRHSPPPVPAEPSVPVPA